MFAFSSSHREGFLKTWDTRTVWKAPKGVGSCPSASTYFKKAMKVI